MGRPRIQVLVDDTTLTPFVHGALQHLDIDVEVTPVDTRPDGPAYTIHKDTGRYNESLELDALADLRREIDTLKRRNKAYRENIRRLDDQLHLTASLQRNLQSPTPTVDGAHIHTVYCPADVVSGDIYEVVRLDNTHVAIAVADATGHGLPAGLLSTFVQQSLRGKDVTGNGYRLLEPDEVLTRANASILEARLQECQFVTALYARYDERTRTIRWARGGAPYPILVRNGQRPRQLVSNGPLLGALPRARFEVAEFQLEPGDTLLFHTDGLEAFLLSQRCDPERCDFNRTDWFEELGQEPVKEHLERLQTELSGASQAKWERDDVTVVVLNVQSQTCDARGL